MTVLELVVPTVQKKVVTRPDAIGERELASLFGVGRVEIISPDKIAALRSVEVLKDSSPAKHAVAEPPAPVVL